MKSDTNKFVVGVDVPFIREAMQAGTFHKYFGEEIRTFGKAVSVLAAMRRWAVIPDDNLGGRFYYKDGLDFLANQLAINRQTLFKYLDTLVIAQHVVPYVDGVMSIAMLAAKYSEASESDFYHTTVPSGDYHPLPDCYAKILSLHSDRVVMAAICNALIDEECNDLTEWSCQCKAISRWARIDVVTIKASFRRLHEYGFINYCDAAGTFVILGGGVSDKASNGSDEWSVHRRMAHDSSCKLFESLRAIRDDKLYQDDFNSFEGYLEGDLKEFRAWSHINCGRELKTSDGFLADVLAGYGDNLKAAKLIYDRSSEAERALCAMIFNESLPDEQDTQVNREHSLRHRMASVSVQRSSSV